MLELRPISSRDMAHRRSRKSWRRRPHVAARFVPFVKSLSPVEDRFVQHAERTRADDSVQPRAIVDLFDHQQSRLETILKLLLILKDDTVVLR